MRNRIESKIPRGIDIAALMLHENRCGKFGQVFGAAIIYARRILRRLSVHDRAQVFELIELLEEVRKPLVPPLLGLVRLHPDDPLERLFHLQNRCIRVGNWAIAALAVYDDDQRALRNFSGIVRTSEEILARALVENHLRGWKDWRDPDKDGNTRNPEAWIRSRAFEIAAEEAKSADAPDDTISRRDVFGRRRRTVSLDDEENPVDEVKFSEPGTVERVYSFDGLKAAARRKRDADLVSYIEGWEDASDAGIKDQEKAHRLIRLERGWNKFKASAVRRRFEKLKLRAGADFVSELISSRPGCDASRTVYREVLFEGERGTEGPFAFKTIHPPKGNG